MAYIPGSDWDVFISYARNDDRPLFEGERGWVTTFVRALKVAVSNFLGAEVRFFFDLDDAGQGFENLEFIKTCVARSALMVSIVSPTYCGRPWTLAELEVFCGRWPDLSRLFALELLPIGPENNPPAQLEQKNRAKFWRDLDNPNVKAPLNCRDSRFNDVLLDFASHLKDRLRLLRAEGPREPGHRPPPPSAPDSRTRVLIASGTDDVAEEIDGVRRHLGQYPDRLRLLPPEGYPDPEAALALFTAQLRDADLVVQLLGTSPGRALAQRDAAIAAGKPLLQWRHPELDLAALADDGYRAMLADPRVATSGLEEFKARILAETVRAEPAPVLVDAARVFINADRDNTDVAEGIGYEFARADYSPAFPKFDGSASENRQYLNKMMAECGVLVLVHGCPYPAWVANQKRMFEFVRQQRKAEPDGLAVCTVPPGERLDPTLIGNEFEQIDCSAGFEAESVRGYIAALKQRGAPQPIGA
jgi:hypothetical protein